MVDLKSSKGKCKECKKMKELTLHGTCWPCHLGKISIHARIAARKKD